MDYALSNFSCAPPYHLPEIGRVSSRHIKQVIYMLLHVNHLTAPVFRACQFHTISDRLRTHKHTKKNAAIILLDTVQRLRYNPIRALILLLAIEIAQKAMIMAWFH